MTLTRSMASLALAGSLCLLSMVGGGGCAERSLVAVRDTGDVYLSEKKYDAAIEQYQEYVNRSPGNAYVYYRLGQAYLGAGQTGLARENALVAHSLRVEDDAIFAGAADALYADKNYEQLNRLLRARTIDRGKMQDFLLLGKYSELQGDVDEAQRAYLTGAQVDGGNSWQPHLALAKLYKKVGDKRRYDRRLAMAFYAGPNEPAVIEEVRQSGAIPGPTFGIPPAEAGGGEPDAATLPARTAPLTPATGDK
jgi:tetratricopeptide (TPR) repeat protein